MIAFTPHDHTACRARSVAAAKESAKRQGLRLTPIRQRTLEILLEEHRAMGAYDVLARLAEGGHAAHPPVAYRALDFLVKHGFAHKIERLAAFVACLHPDKVHRPAFLICRSCRLVAEADIPPSNGVLGQKALAMGFAIEDTAIEAVGLCPACQGNA